MTRTHCVEYQSRPTQALRRLSKPRFRGAHLIVRNPEEGQA